MIARSNAAICTELVFAVFPLAPASSSWLQVACPPCWSPFFDRVHPIDSSTTTTNMGGSSSPQHVCVVGRAAAQHRQLGREPSKAEPTSNALTCALRSN